VVVYPLYTSPAFAPRLVPFRPIKFNILNNAVITDVRTGNLRSITDCAILSRKDWECRDTDKLGRFGFRNGEFFTNLYIGEYRYTYSWEWNFVRCRAEFTEKDFFIAARNCLTGWK
jgi:hypothetical protein